MTSKPATTLHCDAIEVLLSGYADQELTQQDAQKVRIHIDTCSRCRQIHADLVAVKEQMKQLSYPVSDEAMLEALENDYLARAGSLLGWGLLIPGILIVTGIGLFGFFASPEVPGVVRFLYGLFMLGGLALFGSVLRQRLITYKTDKYKKVKL
jgi:hypothetical protein